MSNRAACLFVLAAGASALFCLAACKAFPRAERVFFNGHIITMDDFMPGAQAFAVAGGKIVAVGSNEKILRAYPEIVPIDLHRRTVMPGIVESHVHLLSLGQTFIELNVESAESPDQAVELVRQRAAQTPAGDWITGWGWDEGAWAKAYPTNEKLSRAAPQNPVWLRGLHGFAGWANARALEIAGITRDTPNPAKGEILKDPKTGQPTGILKDAAQALLTAHIPPLSAALIAKALTLAGTECLSYGMTTVHDANVTKPELEVLRSLAAKGRLKTRIYAMLDATDNDLIEPFLQQGPALDPDGWLTVRCIKIFADGALGSRGAALFEPYADAPETSGALTTSRADIERVTTRALKSGMQVAVHAIGDRANRITLDAYEAALKAVPEAKDPRLRIEHAQVVALQDIPRFKGLGILASMQPPHCTSDMAWAEDRLGSKRIEGAYAWRRFVAAGVRVPLNSDFPGESPDPFWGMYAAETRQSADGKPAGGWHADQCLTRSETLRAYTVESAYAGFEENNSGQIAPGMFADFILISGNILSMPSKALLTLRVDQTYIGGNLVYSRR